jgi:hypothetical protein
MRILGTIIIWTLLTSCATTVTRKTYNLKVSSNTTGDKIELDKKVYALPTVVNVKRSKTDLQIKLISDTVVSAYTVRSSPNPAFTYGNLLWMQVCPAAYLIDLTNQKRFYYGKSIYLDNNDSLRIITPRIRKGFENYFSQKYSKRKGQLNLALSLPHINSFYLKPEGEGDKINTGFWGLSIGLEYFYKDDRYINLSANAVSDFFVPVPAAVDISGEYELMTSTYFSLTNNYKVNRFHFGYGINYSRNTWDFRFYDRFGPPPPTRDPIKKSSASIGLTLNGYYQITKSFLIGLIYRPTFIRISPTTELKYEHLFSLDIGWRIALKK